MYVLLTAAKNEAKFIGQTIESISRQTIKPLKWVIVDDGSEDGTDDIIKNAQLKHEWITLVKRKSNRRSFRSKAEALNLAWETIINKTKMNEACFNFVGIIDADITVPSDYYEHLMVYFGWDQKLGLAGGWVHEWSDRRFQPRRFNREYSAPGSVQFFRRQIFESIGGIPFAIHGGEDSACEVLVRSRGFEVRSFKDLPVFHHKKSITNFQSGLHYAFREGRMDASLGCLFIYHLARDINRAMEKPAILGVFLRLAGYLYERLKGTSVLSPETLAFFREEQRARLRQALASAACIIRKSHK